MRYGVWDEVVSFIRAKLSVSPKKIISPVTNVVDDLDLNGDHADEFMWSFFKRFEVSSGDYEFENYFIMDGEGVFYHLVQRYVLRNSHTFKRRPMTVGMLFNAACTGRWLSNQGEAVVPPIISGERERGEENW